MRACGAWPRSPYADPLIDAADRATTAECFPSADLRVIRGVGHFLHLERESVMDTYLEFAQASGHGSARGAMEEVA